MKKDDWITILFLIFLVLKLTNCISWSWWWVTSPVWLPALIIIFFMIIIAVVIDIAKNTK